ncbi:hypothetical protein TcasGA2_TC011489 [Tribolium castaneum]|uniref:Uncharacterized protein n=1 Tax=Tribolium castaneum TaxID=7070 RepID=D7EK80_TRICA|nr:hypothetical protein TcasGA2_TC011489 [Tribolium castaneum]
MERTFSNNGKTVPVNYRIKEIRVNKEMLVHADRLKLWKRNTENEMDNQSVTTERPLDRDEVDNIEPPEVPEHYNLNLWYLFRDQVNDHVEETSETSSLSGLEWDGLMDHPIEIVSKEEESLEGSLQEPDQEDPPHPYRTRSQGPTLDHPWVLPKRI